MMLSKDKTKGQFRKNTILTLTEILPKKYGHFPIKFQITLSVYPHINQIFKIKTIYIK